MDCHSDAATNQLTAFDTAITAVELGNVFRHSNVDDYLKEVDG